MLNYAKLRQIDSNARVNRMGSVSFVMPHVITQAKPLDSKMIQQLTPEKMGTMSIENIARSIQWRKLDFLLCTA